jgi:hypothetical protein
MCGLLNVLLPAPCAPLLKMTKKLARSAAGEVDPMPMCTNECVLFTDAAHIGDPLGERQFGEAVQCPACDSARLKNNKPRHVQLYHQTRLCMHNPPPQPYTHICLFSQRYVCVCVDSLPRVDNGSAFFVTGPTGGTIGPGGANSDPLRQSALWSSRLCDLE